MSFNQWFWKYGYLVIPLFLALAWFVTGEKFQNQDKVNPEIFEYFKKVDQECTGQNFDKLPKQCAEIHKYKDQCSKLSASCDSKTFYDLLLRLNYPLPSYLVQNNP